MSTLVNCKEGMGPTIDPRLKNKLYFNTTCELNDKLIKLFSTSIWAVAEELEKEKLLEEEKLISRINCITIDSDEFTIKLDNNQLAMRVSLAVYPIHKWTKLTDVTICTNIIEELCHHYWNISDEVEVNFKVIKVLKRICPNIKMGDIYNTEWMNNELKKQGKDAIDFSSM